MSVDTVIADELGPKSKRLVWIFSILTMIVVGVLVGIGIKRFYDKGQLDAAKWESFTDPGVIKFLALGLVETLKAAAVAMVLAIAIGALIALARLAHNWFVRCIARIYVEFFRGIPLLLLMLFSVVFISQYFDVETIWYVVLALTLYNSAMLSEVFRAGILSLDRGQTEAATSLGLGYWQTMFLVVIPQAARRMAPSIVSQLVTLLKDTALGYAIAFEELSRRGRINGDYYLNILQSLIVVAIIYFLVNFALSRLSSWLEHRQVRKGRTATPEAPKPLTPDTPSLS